MSFSDDDVPSSHSVHSIFGSSLEGEPPDLEGFRVFEGFDVADQQASSSWEAMPAVIPPVVSAPRAAPDSQQDSSPGSSNASSSSSSDGVVLLQRRLAVRRACKQSNDVPLAGVPTPCRALGSGPPLLQADSPQGQGSAPLPKSSAPLPASSIPTTMVASQYPVGVNCSARTFATQHTEAHFWTPFGSRTCSPTDLLLLLSRASADAERNHGPPIPLDLFPILHSSWAEGRASTVKALADAAQLVSTLCGGAFFMTPCPLLWGMDLSAATLDALCCLQGPTTHFTSLPFGSCVHLFTDGSGGDSRAGWAVVVLVQLPCHRWLFQGVLAASSDAQFFGEYLHTSGEAEAAGVCAALSWALSLPSGVPFRVHTDCDWARCQAAGLWGQGAKQVKGSAFFNFATADPLAPGPAARP